METPLEIDVTAAARQWRDGALLLDVREPHEVAVAAVPGSRFIPMREIPAALAGLPRDQPILVLCHIGGRSFRVAQFLRAHGFDQAVSVAGGIDAWAREIDPTLPRY